ncbi:DNA/RNA polymerase [Dendrothele bispora CBS 962.96]|uniref:DNA-directed RNA polymerase n=1 Tax=Dendrothele bispora (strain CBS 962.96) TaxID=1314807 RepID=A0A4S8MIT7_DENBC|nr:DNA/RNA polymerase [Dendrothele bispora CBS 962.96]
MEGFLNSQPRLTFLPTPRPEQSNQSRVWWFQDSATQDLLAIMDACLHQLHDVPRAKGVFTRLRQKWTEDAESSSVTSSTDPSSHPFLEPRLYNAFLEAYLSMASTPGKGTANKDYWIESAWELYDAMESGKEGVEPTAGTYATMLLLLLRFGSESASKTVSSAEAGTMPKKDLGAVSATTLLKNLLDRKIAIESIVADRVFGSGHSPAEATTTASEEARGVIRVLSQAAVQLGMGHVVNRLGDVEEIGKCYEDESQDALAGIPEAMPVVKEVKSASSEEDANKPKEPTYEVPFNLSNLRRHLARISFARRILPDDVVSRQKLLEESVYDVAVARLKHESEIFEDLGLDKEEKLRNPDLRRWMWDWHCKLEERLNQVVKGIGSIDPDMKLKRRKKTPELSLPLKPASLKNILDLSPYLTLVNPARLSLITILEVMRLSGSGGVSEGMKTTRALIQVGKAVEMEYKAQMCRRYGIWVPATSSPSNPANAFSDSAEGGRRASYFSPPGYTSLFERRFVAAKHQMEAESWTAEWTQPTRARVGGILVECLMDVAQVVRTAQSHGPDGTTSTITETQPAFHHCYEHHRGQKLGVIRLNPVVSERLAKDTVKETLHPRHLPMLVKPKPWLRHDEGGYLYNRVPVMRYKESVEQLSFLQRASELGNVELIYAGLDVLGNTPWKINKGVFDVVLEVWNSGKRLGKLPPAFHDEPEPELPHAVGPDGKVLYDMNGKPLMDIKAKTLYMAKMKHWTQAKANTHSDRCSVNYKIEIARTFLGDTIYFPHNIDFRGRAYPVPPHLNHIGDDLSRGLLVFAEGKPLGERGLRWLKIHIANLSGFDKANFDERVKFVEDRLDDIRDSAENPLNGRKWWTNADDPWQCLGACMELTKALDSPDPLKFESCFPVHQDGTCNGLQHYAALGGDSRGAAQVNLAAGDRPSDVYTYVGKMAEKTIDADVAKGEKYAMLLQGKITRKMVKQTVMTTVYGVTFIGAREQIERQIRASKQIPEEDVWGTSAYLAKVVLACIGDLFTGAKDIQMWLTICARLIAKAIPGERIPEALEEYKVKKRQASERAGKRNKGIKSPSVEFLRKEQMTSVVWTTPLGLPVVQPYRKPKRKQIMTAMQTVYISDPNSPAEVNTMKQASAFPPNFIHSLDATHMMLTALECKTQSLTFAAVHDSYWTHACDIDRMSSIIRDTFIALHSSDVLTKLHDEFRERYKNYKIPLVHLRNGILNKALRDAGSRITVTSEQAESLGIGARGGSNSNSFGNLITVSDEEKSSIDESDETRELKNLLIDLAGKEGGLEGKDEEALIDSMTNAKTNDGSENEDDLMEGEEEDEDWESPRARATRLRKSMDNKAIMDLLGKFVNLTDLIPPLPKKGDFKVEAIKASQYFFS